MNYTLSKTESQYYNYIYLDPRKPGQYCYEGLNFSLLYEPFYVGKGKNNRHLKHLIPYSLNKNTYKNNKIRAINKSFNIKDYILIINNGNTNEDVCTLEIELIDKIGRISLQKGTLTNLTAGGDGAGSGDNNTQSFFYMTKVKNMTEEEAKFYFKEKGMRSGDKLRGIPLSQDAKLAISKATKGVLWDSKYTPEKSKELREKISEQFSGDWESRFGLERTMVLKNDIRLRNTGREKTQDEKDRRSQTIKERGSLSGVKNPSTKPMFIINHNTNETIDLTGMCAKYCIENGISHKFFKEFTNQGIITKSMLIDKYKHSSNCNSLVERVSKYIGLEFIAHILPEKG
jgi:hypothetical protein